MIKIAKLNAHETLTAKFIISVIGNQPGYFSLTGEISDSRRRTGDKITARGCLHDQILQEWPDLADAEAMHLSNADTGEPMHAAANGWYWYSGAVVEAGLEPPQGAGKYIGKPTGGRTCAEIFADHCRIGESLAAELIQQRMTSQQFHEWIGEQRPRWQAQADAINCKETRVLGDHMKLDGSSQPLFTLSDGMLYDARKLPWSNCCANPVRAIYSQLFQAIENTEHMRACLRHGAHCYGSGEIMFYTSDGACLCFKCARDEYRSISQSIRQNMNDGWRVIGLWDSGSSDDPEYCAHCNKFVSAYEDESEYLERIAEGDES